MAERQLTGLVAALAVLLVLALMWDAFGRPHARRPPTPPLPTATPVPDTVPARPLARAETVPMQASQGAAVQPSGPGYLELLGRSETRRRIRASAGITYLNDMMASSADSMLHRWDNRIRDPVRVYLGSGTAANFQPVFLDEVRSAFARWQEAGVPVRFDPGADSTTAEVRFRWRLQFDVDRSGQTDLEWDQDGQLHSGVVTLATFDPKGRPMDAHDVRVVALHEIGHLIGLEHSPDSTDLMYANTKVRDLSGRDIQSALLLYQLPSGPIR